VSAFNSLYGYYVYKRDTSPPDIPLLNGDPESNSTKDTITLKISLQKPRGETDNRLLYILISDKNNNSDSHKLQKFGLKNFQIAASCTLEPSQNSLSVTIGNAYQFDNCSQTNDLPLQPATLYKITVLLLHTFQNKNSHNIYTFMYKTLDTRHKTVDTRHKTVDTRYKTLNTSEQVYLFRPIHFQKSFSGLLFLALLILPVIGYLYV
jgi:hypothetical protein